MRKIIMASITAVVVIAVLAGTLIPVLDDATATQETLENAGYYSMDKIASTDSDTHTIVWDSTDAGVLTVDDVDIDISAMDLSGNSAYTIFATETDFFRIAANSTATAFSWVQLRGSTVTYASASSSFSATISAGSVTAVLDGTSKTITYTDAYVINASGDGDYVMKKSTESAYMLEDSEIYAIGTTNVSDGTSTAVTAFFKLSGNIDGVTVTTLYYSGSNEVTTSDVAVVASEVSDYVGVSAFDKVTFTATCNETDTACTYSYVIVPAEVTAEKSVHFTDGENAILDAIPVIVIVALLLGVVAIVLRSRMD